MKQFPTTVLGMYKLMYHKGNDLQAELFPTSVIL